MDVQENKEGLNYAINTLITLAENYEEKSEDLIAHLGDYLTVDIATEWEKPFMDLVYKLFNQNILTQKQVSIFEEIDKRFSDVSIKKPFYEKGIWTLEGLKSHLFWKEQRKLAKELLAELEKIKLF